MFVCLSKPLGVFGALQEGSGNAGVCILFISFTSILAHFWYSLQIINFLHPFSTTMYTLTGNSVGDSTDKIPDGFLQELLQRFPFAGSSSPMPGNGQATTEDVRSEDEYAIYEQDDEDDD